MWRGMIFLKKTKKMTQPKLGILYQDLIALVTSIT